MLSLSIPDQKYPAPKVLGILNGHSSNQYGLKTHTGFKQTHKKPPKGLFAINLDNV